MKSYNDYLKENLNNIIYDLEEVTNKEYSNLSKEDKKDIILHKNIYYRRVPIDYKEEDIHTGLLIEIYKQMYELNRKQNTIIAILIIFSFVAVMSLLGFFS